VAYHIAVGVDHIQIYDNESAVPIRRVLRKWIMAGKVDGGDREGGKDSEQALYPVSVEVGVKVGGVHRH